MTTVQNYTGDDSAAMDALPPNSEFIARLGLRAEGAMRNIAAVNMLALMLLTMFDVIGRYFFATPIPGALEITEMLLATCVATSLPGVIQREENVSIDLFDRFFQRPIVRTLHRPAVGLIVSICCGFISWRLWSLAAQMHAAGETSATLAIPMYPVAYAMAVMVTVSTVVSCLVTLGFLSTSTEAE